MMKTPVGRGGLGFAGRGNTMIGAVATNAKLTKAQATKVTQMAQNGLGAPSNQTRPHHAGWRRDLCIIHWREKSRRLNRRCLRSGSDSTGNPTSSKNGKSGWRITGVE